MNLFNTETSKVDSIEVKVASNSKIQIVENSPRCQDENPEINDETVLLDSKPEKIAITRKTINLQENKIKFQPGAANNNKYQATVPRNNLIGL